MQAAQGFESNRIFLPLERQRKPGRVRAPLDLLGPFSIPGLERRYLVRLFRPQPGIRDASVLVMFDGQNLFHDAPSFGGGWHLHEFVERMARRGLVSPVVVGIDHGGENRLDELTPFSHDAGPGRLDPLLDWIEGDLLDGLRQRYGLTKSPRKTVVGGSSLGGLAAFYAHWTRPKLFGGSLCMSPALWYAGAGIFNCVATRKPPSPSRIYLDCGKREAAGNLLRITKKMVELLGWRGYPTPRLRFRVDRKGEHRERDWSRRCPVALRFLYASRWLK